MFDRSMPNVSLKMSAEFSGEIPVWAVIKLAELYGVTTDYILGLSDRRDA